MCAVPRTSEIPESAASSCRGIPGYAWLYAAWYKRVPYSVAFEEEPTR